MNDAATKSVYSQLMVRVCSVAYMQYRYMYCKLSKLRHKALQESLQAMQHTLSGLEMKRPCIAGTSSNNFSSFMEEEEEEEIHYVHTASKGL